VSATGAAGLTYARAAPEVVTPEIGLWGIQPLPGIPGAELHGSPVVIAAGAYIGPAADA
jgi:hypothetical protein